MSLAVVLTAEQPENNSAVVVAVTGVAEATGNKEKCILPYALHVEKTHRCHSSHEMDDRCTAATVFQERDVKDNSISSCRQAGNAWLVYVLITLDITSSTFKLFILSYLRRSCYTLGSLCLR